VNPNIRDKSCARCKAPNQADATFCFHCREPFVTTTTATKATAKAKPTKAKAKATK
jgi:hypothetical protein